MHNVICNSVCEGIWQLVNFFGKMNLLLFLNWACYNIYVNLDGLTKHIAWLYILFVLEIRLLCWLTGYAVLFCHCAILYIV